MTSMWSSAGLGLRAAIALASWCGIARGADKPEIHWVNITEGLGGDKWGSGGVTTMATAPDGDSVIAGVSESGLWGSADGGKTWKKLGDKDAPPIKNRPYQIVFDPKQPARFWESGSNGPGVFRTDDAGVTFHRLGNVENCAGIAIDFADPERKTIYVGFQGSERSVMKSTDAGATWVKIGDKLPAKTNISSDVLLLDSKTLLVNAAGWKREGADLLAFGVFRSEDSGGNFTKVSDEGPSGPPLLASDGAIYWQALWNKGLLKSSDQGKTWQLLPGPVKVNPIELPGGKLAAPVESSLQISSDGGKTWEKVGGPLPFSASGLTFSAKTRALYAWRSTDAREENVVVRCELP